MIIDYHDSQTRRRSYSRDNWKPQDDKWYLDRELLNDRPETCPYCASKLILIQNKEIYGKLNLTDFLEDRQKAEQSVDLEAKVCPKCNWWQVRLNLVDLEHYDCNSVSVTNSTIKKFDISSIDAPITELANYLTRRIDHVYQIHFKKMEELVAAVFKNHFSCDVIHCGQSHDRGIDLMLVQGEELVPIQVKRRIKPGKTEGVALIREMLGVMYRDQSKSSIIVSSADKFSKEAQAEVIEVKQKQLIDQFDLIDLGTLHGIMRNYFGMPDNDPFLAVAQLCK